MEKLRIADVRTQVGFRYFRILWILRRFNQARQLQDNQGSL